MLWLTLFMGRDGCHDADKFARGYDFGLLPELRKMPVVAGDQIIGAGRIGAFEKDVVVGVARYPQSNGGLNKVAAVFDPLQELLALPLHKR